MLLLNSIGAAIALRGRDENMENDFLMSQIEVARLNVPEEIKNSPPSSIGMCIGDTPDIKPDFFSNASMKTGAKLIPQIPQRSPFTQEESKT